MIHASYLYMPIAAPGQLVIRAREAIEKLGGGVDAVVGTGLSGAMAVPLIASALDLNMCVIRKEDDRGTHSVNRMEGNMEPSDRWIFIDDLIDSGATLASVMEMMGSGCDQYYFVGAYLYCACNSMRNDDYYLIEKLTQGREVLRRRTESDDKK